MKLISGLALSSCVIAGALLSGCSSGGDTTNGTTAGNTTAGANTTDATNTNTASTTATAVKTVPKGTKLKLAFITNNPSDFWTIARKGTEAAEKELKNQVEVAFKIPAGGTVEEQKRIIDDLIATDIHGMAISPKDPANQVQMINDAASKALVFTQDSDAPGSNRACYIGTDNHAAGVQAGEQIKKALPNGGKIMLFVGSLDAQNAQDRKKGIEDALKGSKIQIVDTRTDETDQAKAKSNVSDAMAKDPDLACLVGLWSYNGPAIYNAVKEANKVGKIKIVCFDEEDQTLAGIAQGAISATIVQQPYEFGRMSILMMAQSLWGDQSKIPANKQIFVKTLVVDKSNVATFTTKLNKLRGRS